MKRDCEACGRQYSAKTCRSRYCADVECKRRRERARKRGVGGGKVTDLPVGENQEPPSVYAVTLAQLERLARVDSAAGQNVLVLAKRLDTSSDDTGSAVAALSKQHLAALAEAVKDAQVEADSIEQLREKSAQRRLSLVR